MSLEAWCRFGLAEQGYVPAAHHLVIIEALEKLAAGKTQRLMLLLPPGSAKSTYASVYFPAWWMARFPRDQIIAASHTARLAEHFGRSVRSKLAAHGARLDVFLRPDARAAGRFSTEGGGEYFAVGVHGAVAGRRADLAIIDDPVASLETAVNAISRERVWSWYRSELVTRLKPGGRIVLAMTRWHRDDLAGRLIEQGGWEVISLPALAGVDDPMGRQVGDALWPEWESRSALLEKQEAMGDASFAAMFQQSPMDEQGSIFDVAKIGFVDTVSEGPSARGWDLASGTHASRDPDWTVGVRLTKDAGGGYVVDDVRRERVGPAELDPLVMAVARQDGTRVTVGLPQDPGQAGAHQVLTLTRALAGFRVQASTEKGPKWQRAQFIASQVARGNLKLRRAPWNRLFIEELAAFPHGRKDDQVDALARAFSLLVTTGAPARFAAVPFFER